MSSLTSLEAQTVKLLPAMRETRFQSLNWEDSLEKAMATHSSTLAWKISWTEETWYPTVHGVAESDVTEQLSDELIVKKIKDVATKLKFSVIQRKISFWFSFMTS